jgi:hypothetical protein
VSAPGGGNLYLLFLCSNEHIIIASFPRSSSPPPRAKPPTQTSTITHTATVARHRFWSLFSCSSASPSHIICLLLFTCSSNPPNRLGISCEPSAAGSQKLGIAPSVGLTITTFASPQRARVLRSRPTSHKLFYRTAVYICVVPGSRDRWRRLSRGSD